MAASPTGVRPASPCADGSTAHSSGHRHLGDAHRGTEPRRGRTWVAGDFCRTGPHCSAGQQPQLRPELFRDNGEVAWRAIPSGKAEDLLDQPVLQRVVGQYGDPTVKRERRDGTRQYGFERFELGVDLDPEGLKRALRGMATGLAGSRGDRVIQQLDQSTRGDEGLALALGDYSPSNPVGVPFLAVRAQDSGQFCSGIGIET